MTKEERKQKALNYMKELNIYKPYIEGFEKHDFVCYFDIFAGFWAWQNEKLQNKIKEIEKKYNATVYAITHENTSFGELFDFLIVTNYKEEWDSLLTKCEQNQFYVFAYVWNKTDENLSEFGTIVIETFGGGIRRIA